jgi:hypothetical protein
MGLFRALNLLQGVEAQTMLGAALESTLAASPAQEAEFGAMLSTRHMARRMAGNPITMAAINLSNKAIKIVFENTSEYNFRPVEEVAKNSGAMLSTSTALPSLNAVIPNVTAFSYFRSSDFYDTHIFNTLATLIGDLPANHTNLSAMILDSTARNSIAINDNAVTALAYSSDSMDVVVGADTSMILELQNRNGSIDIMAKSNIAVAKLSNSLTALGALTPATRLRVSSVPSALAILGANPTAWNYLMSTSTTLDQTIYGVLIAFGELDPAVFTTVEEIFSDASASEAVANNKPAMIAIINEGDKTRFHTSGGESALDKIIASDNLATVLNSLVAITEIVGDEPTMDLLIANEIAFPILLTSAAAKAAIFASTTLFDTMMTDGSDSLATVQGLAVSHTINNDGVIGAYISLGLPGNIIITSGIMGSIVATTLDNYFRGDSQPDFTIALPGDSASTDAIPMKKPYTNAQWDINSIALTAAAQLTITYVDFN